MNSGVYWGQIMVGGFINPCVTRVESKAAISPIDVVISQVEEAKERDLLGICVGKQGISL